MSAVALRAGAQLVQELDELLDELRRVAEALPVPQASWHPHVAAIAACRRDLEQAIETAAGRPAALRLLAAMLDGAPEPDGDPSRSPELAAARERLAALAVPEGQHPYLDEILPALEALRLLLLALAAAGT